MYGDMTEKSNIPFCILITHACLNKSYYYYIYINTGLFGLFGLLGRATQDGFSEQNTLMKPVPATMTDKHLDISVSQDFEL